MQERMRSCGIIENVLACTTLQLYTTDIAAKTHTIVWLHICWWPPRPPVPIAASQLAVCPIVRKRSRGMNGSASVPHVSLRTTPVTASIPYVCASNTVSRTHHLRAMTLTIPYTLHVINPPSSACHDIDHTIHYKS